MKVLLILAAVGGFFGLVCCGGGAYVIWKFKNNISNDPIVVRKVAAEIVTIDLPESFVPVGSMDFFVGKGVLYNFENGKGILMLGEFKTGGDPKLQSEQMQTQFRQGFNNGRRGNGQDQDLVVEKRETREFTVRGAKVPFEFETGKMPNDETEILRVTGTFTSKGGAGMLMIQAPKEDLDEDEVAEIIESIR